jgi:hypothetical protein
MVEHVAPLDQAGALQNSQSPEVAVMMGGDGTNVEPPLGSALVSIANNRKRLPLPARMEHGRSSLMDECEVMAPGRECAPTTVIPTLSLSLCQRKAANQGTSDRPAHPFPEFLVSSEFNSH